MALQNIPIKLESILTISIEDAGITDSDKIILEIGSALLQAIKAVPFVANVQAIRVEEVKFKERSPLSQ